MSRATHRQPGWHPFAGSRARITLGLPAAVILAVIAYGLIVALYMDPPVSGTTTTQAATLHDAEHRERPTPAPQEPEERAGVDPRCYASQAAAKIGWCQGEVVKTKFLPRYRDGQPQISVKHDDVDTAETMHKVNGAALARQGLELCWLVAQRGTVRNDVIERFMEFHAHPGPVTPEAADQVTRVALTDLCPQRRPEYDRLPKF